jgi:hypothetical protein
VEQMYGMALLGQQMYGVALQENRYMVWHYQDNRCINLYTCTEFEKENKLIWDIYM